MVESQGVHIVIFLDPSGALGEDVWWAATLHSRRAMTAWLGRSRHVVRSSAHIRSGDDEVGSGAFPG